MAARGLPAPSLVLGAAVLTELVGAVCLVLGWHTRLFALVLAGFSLAAIGQLRRPKLAQMLEIEEGHLATTGDIEPVRMRVMTTLSRILATAGLPSEPPMAADMLALAATILNAASARGEDDAPELAKRVDVIVRARANT